jgi:putative transposase
MVVKLCRVGLLAAQGLPIPQAVASVGLTLPAYRDWQSEVDRLKRDEFTRLRMLKAENAELERAVTDLTLRIASLRKVVGNVERGAGRDARLAGARHLRALSGQ